VTANILKIHLNSPHQRYVNMTVEALREGAVICYPTDTVYGLGASIRCKSALEQIYQIKKVSNSKLLSFICKDLKDVAQYAYISNTSYKLMKRCVPGPFTFILPATSKTPKKLFQKRRTVGIRIPDSTICQMLVDYLGTPIVSTSIPAGPDEILNDPEEINRRFGHQVDIILDGGILISEPSTIVDLTEGVPLIVRRGKGDTSLIY
jgi:tRNA threonylcarbamoyl adenosine modification protein (Sua5/YciO/YrdC/YwlC family)